MNIFSIYFILIQLCGIFQKCTNCLFELQMPFSQNDAISDFIFILHIFITLIFIYATYSFCQVGLHIGMKGENNILWDRYIIETALSDAMSQPIV